jgi:hypothetical protein
MPSRSELAAPGCAFVELDRERVELLQREIVVGVLPGLTQPALDRVAVALGEVVEHVSLLVDHTALHRHIAAEHLADGFPQRLPAVQDEQQPLLDVQATIEEIGEQRRCDGGVLGRSFPQPERELLAGGRDPQRDDVRAAVQLDPVEHHHRRAQIRQRPVHQLPQHVAGALHERA